jgi:hypothetical protein
LVHVKPFSSLYKFYCFKVSKLKTILTVNHTKMQFSQGYTFHGCEMQFTLLLDLGVLGLWCLAVLTTAF